MNQKEEFFSHPDEWYLKYKTGDKITLDGRETVVSKSFGKVRVFSHDLASPCTDPTCEVHNHA